MHASVTTVFRSAISEGSISSASASPASAWRTSGTFPASAGSANSTRDRLATAVWLPPVLYG